MHVRPMIDALAIVGALALILLFGLLSTSDAAEFVFRFVDALRGQP